MKMIHWEYNEGMISDRFDLSLTVKAGIVRNSDTDKSEGFYFKWNIQCQTPKGLLMTYTAEDSYPRLDIRYDDIIIQDMEQVSLQKFEYSVNEKIIPLGYGPVSLSLDFPVAEAFEVANELNQ